VTEPVFRTDGELFVPTAHARGPWDPRMQHGGAPAALIAREVERAAPDMRVARLTIEFLGQVPLLPLDASAEVTRPGRRMQVVEASVSAAGKEVCRARASLIRAEHVDGLAQNGAPPPTPGPDDLEPATFESLSGEGFGTTTMELRFATGDFDETGPATTWFRLRRPVIEGEEPSPLQRTVAAADFGNGISRLLDWNEWLFVNTDLTLHLHREAEGDWIALDARTALEPNGSGLALSTLYDQRGAIGFAAQSLFVAPR
jgi:acyl-CoA thioesterase